MALVVADRVQETTTVTGTGSATLLGAVAGYQPFSVLGTGSTTHYCIQGQATTEWEVGLGTFTAPSTLARTTVLSSSNSGALVRFSAGTKNVFVTAPAAYAVTRRNYFPTAGACPMFDRRRGAGACLLADGRLFVCGGNAGGGALASAEILDVGMGAWFRVADAPTAREGCAACLLQDGRVFVCGGDSRKTAEIYNPTTNVWSAVADMAGFRIYPTACLLPDGRVFVCGGGTATAEIYNPTSGTWSSTSNMPQVVPGVAVCRADGLVYVVLGDEYSGYGFVYNPKTDVWVSRTSMAPPIPGVLFAMALVDDNTLFLCGGERSVSVFQRANTTYSTYSFSTSTWAPLAYMQRDRAEHTAIALPNGGCLVVGGWGNNGTSGAGYVSLGTYEIYNPCT